MLLPRGCGLFGFVTGELRRIDWGKYIPHWYVVYGEGEFICTARKSISHCEGEIF